MAFDTTNTDPTFFEDKFLVDGVLVNGPDAQAFFNDAASESGITGKQGEQYVAQHMIQAEHLGKKAMDVSARAALEAAAAPKDHTLRQMGQQQQAGGQNPIIPDYQEQQLAKQRKQLAANRQKANPTPMAA